jgi:glycosyltransferase involved in cell wall biosynthesis
MNNSPLVSVVITTYNRVVFLEKAIESVVNQTYTNIEIIVVDDGSKENYAESICKKYSNCSYFYKKNGGISSARNFGVKNAKGQFIAFLDDDDLFMPNKIEEQVAILLKDNNIYCVHSSALVINDEGMETGEIIGANSNKAHLRTGYVFWNALGSWCVKSPTPLIRKEVFSKVLFDEKIVVSEDFDFYQRLFYYFEVFYINKPLAYYRESNQIERLSQLNEKYIGVESQFYENYLKMGIKNPITLYKIALKLTLIGIKNWNSFYKENLIQVPKWKIYINPYYYIKNLKKLGIKPVL